MQKFDEYLAGVQRGLAAVWGPAAGRRTAKAVLMHCLRFTTWQSLVQQGHLAPADAARACVGWIEDIVDRERRAR